MAKLVLTLIPILFLLAAAATTARSQTTSFSYNFVDEQPTDLTLQGIAEFPKDPNESFLRLTSAKKNQVGRVLHTKPIEFWQYGGSQVNFKTSFNFQINRNGDNIPADGIAFFIAPRGSDVPVGSTGANLGVFSNDGNNPGVFAVEFATFVNGAESGPYYPSVGINIGTPTPINKTFVGAGIIGEKVNARISYVAETKQIDVVVTTRTKEFTVSYVYDLKNLLEQEVQVGLSASTGSYVAEHDIVSWNFFAKMNYVPVIKEYVM